MRAKIEEQLFSVEYNDYIVNLLNIKMTESLLIEMGKVPYKMKEKK